MRITFKLFAMLGDRLPAELDGQRRAGNELIVEVPDGACVQDVIDRFKLSSRQVHLVLVNGVYVSAQTRAAHVLHGGDELAIWPPIAGG